MAKKGPGGPERTADDEPVWVMDGITGMQVVGITDDRVYITEDNDLAKLAAEEMKGGASVADAETQFRFDKVERVWCVAARNSIDFKWATKSGSKSFKLLCEDAVRNEILDEMEDRLGDDFTRVERKVKAGEVIQYPLGCLGIAVVLAVVLGLAVGGGVGLGIGGALVAIALLWLVVVLLKPETVVELVPAD